MPRPSPASAAFPRHDPLLIVELAGLPGAGKTAVAGRVAAQLRSQGFACGERRLVAPVHIGRMRYYGGRVAFSLRHRRPLAAALRFGLGVRPLARSSITHALSLAAWAYRLRVAADQGYDRVILDQGIVQDAWSVVAMSERWNAEALDRTLRNILLGAPATWVLAYLDVDIDVAAERIGSRPTSSSRFDRLDTAATRRLLTTGRDRLEQIVDRAVAVTQAPHCRLDGHRPLEDTAARLVDFIDSVAHAART